MADIPASRQNILVLFKYFNSNTIENVDSSDSFKHIIVEVQTTYMHIHIFCNYTYTNFQSTFHMVPRST